MGKIILNQITAMAIIGTLPDERLHRQKLTIDVELECDITRAMQSDELADAVDYSLVERKVVECVENSSFFLLERLIGAISQTVMSDERITMCRIAVDKERGSAHGRSVRLENTFTREDMAK